MKIKVSEMGVEGFMALILIYSNETKWRIQQLVPSLRGEEKSKGRTQGASLRDQEIKVIWKRTVHVMQLPQFANPCQKGLNPHALNTRPSLSQNLEAGRDLLPLLRCSLLLTFLTRTWMMILFLMTLKSRPMLS